MRPEPAVEIHDQPPVRPATFGRGRSRAVRLVPCLLSVLLLAGPAAAPARAQEAAGGREAGARELAVSLGAFDVSNGETAVEAGVEWRFRPRAYRLVPTVGATVTSDAGLYVFGGLRRDFRWGERLFVTPHFSVTLFEEGDGRDLGHVVEFRSGIELSWPLGDGSRLGLSLYHLSNAGLSGTNPGSESLVLVYSF